MNPPIARGVEAEPAASAIAARIVHKEGRLLDRRDWQGWLDLYVPDALFRVPAWRDEATETVDPAREISLIHHESRRGLEERVMRVRSQQSVTALPLPRTTHFASGIEGAEVAPGRIEAEANLMIAVHDPRTALSHSYFGWCELTLRADGTDWRIARKIFHLQNDCVAAVLDFYML